MEKLKLSAVRKPLPFKVESVNLWFNLSFIIKDAKDIDFDVFLPTKNMNLQREFCWSIAQKQELIISLLKKRYIPPICALVDARKDKLRYEIIDGKQRLNAMLTFIKGEYPIYIDDIAYYFCDLERDAQYAIEGYSPKCIAAYFYDKEPISDDAKIEWFEQINFSGTIQDVLHLDQLKRSKK